MWGTGSLPINFLMVDKTAVMHIVKYEKVKVIGDDLNLAGQGFDGYTIFARIYHDVFCPDNKRVGLYCSVQGSGAPMGSVLDILLEGNYIKSITTWPGEKIALPFVANAGQAIGTALGSLTGAAYVRVGDVIDWSKDYYSVINGEVAAIWRPINITATTPDNSHKFNVYMSAAKDGVQYKYVQQATAPTTVTGTDVESGAELTASDDYATYIVAYTGADTLLKVVKVADAY